MEFESGGKPDGEQEEGRGNMLKVLCGESGFMLDIDGQESEAHLYGFACVQAGPSGAMYAAFPQEEPEEGGRVQLYRLTPVDSITETGVELEEDVEGSGVVYAELQAVMDAGLVVEDEGGEGEDGEDGEDEDGDEDGDDEEEGEVVAPA